MSTMTEMRDMERLLKVIEEHAGAHFDDDLAEVLLAVQELRMGMAANPNVATGASGVGYVDPDSECTRHVWLRVRTEDGRTGALLCRDCSSTLWQHSEKARAWTPGF